MNGRTFCVAYRQKTEWTCRLLRKTGGIADRALNDKDLYFSVMEHRRIFIGLRGFDYMTLLPQTLNVIPPIEIMERWRQDYREMQNSMIYGQSPSYDDLIAKLQELNKKINSIRLS